VDADAFAAAAEAALAGGDLERLAAAAAGWTGEPLPEDCDEPWAAVARDHLTGLQARLLAALAEGRGVAGDAAGAVDAARRRVELDPLDEAAQRRLMLAYARAGRRGHALRQYLAARRALPGGPGAETRALRQRILSGEAP
jgi:DNA-binding SARP family transcriptional activator